MERLAWKKFRGFYSEDTLRGLLAVIGTDKRDEVVREAVRSIQERQGFHSTDTEFLLACDRVDEAEAYIVSRRAQIEGDYYPGLLRLLEALEGRQRPLAESVLYRALLDSILKRAISKYYHHAVRYLRRLDRVAPGVEDWQDVPSHAEYMASLREKHGRKPSFWGRYET